MAEVSFAQASWPRKIQYFNDYDNFARLYNIRLVELDAGFARLEMPMSASVLNSQQRLHGSWQSALIMIAAGKAARSRGQEVRPCKLNVNYHHGVHDGILQIIAREKFRGPHISTCDVEVHCLGDHSVNGDNRQASPQAANPDILVASGRVDFLLLDYQVPYADWPPLTGEKQVYAPLPVWPANCVGLHEDAPGLRPCFREADWPTKRAYLNENEYFYYNEGQRLLDYGPGWGQAEMPVWAQHCGADGLLEPAWLAIFLDPVMGKPSLHAGTFCVTAQMSLTFFEPQAALGGKLLGEGHKVSQEGQFAVYTGSVRDEQQRELAYGVCTMYLRSTEINFRRERPLNYPQGTE